MEWKEVTLGDLCEISSSKRIFAKEYQSDGVPFYRGKEIIAKQKGNAISNELFISRNRYEEIKARYGVPQQRELLLTSVGTLGVPYVIKEEVFYFKDGNLTWFRHFNGLDVEYLYYWFLSPYGKNEINTKAIGSTQKALTIDSLSKFDIKIPVNLDDQRRIASILSSLDRKIELNNKINADLEEMAQAIFKNWFVDFEPFKDGKFVDSELGMIPEGWKVGSYSEIIESLISGDWGKETPQGNYTHEVACVRGCDFQDINNGVRGKTPQRYILEKNYQAKHLKDKDILVEISGGTATVSTGRTSLVTEELLKKYQYDIVCTNFCKVLRPLSQFSSYVYYSWKYKYDNDIMFGYENGTSGIKNFAIKDFIEKEPVLIPKEQDIVEFQKIIDNLQKQKQIKGTENTTISLLRDTLLPRLMSGELEIPE